MAQGAVCAHGRVDVCARLWSGAMSHPRRPPRPFGVIWRLEEQSSTDSDPAGPCARSGLPCLHPGMSICTRALGGKARLLTTSRPRGQPPRDMQQKWHSAARTSPEPVSSR